MTTIRFDRYQQAKEKIGHRCRWLNEGSGTIIGVTVRPGGWPSYTVEWDDNCPEWWSNQVSTAPGPQFIINDYPSVTDEP